MSKLVEVKEFDNIISNKDYEEDSNFKFIDEKSFMALEELILTVGEDAESDGIDFFSISSIRHVGKVIRARNYVGIVQLKNGVQIQILPKIKSCSGMDTKRVFIKMLRSMKDFPSKVFQNASLKTDSMNLYEVFINMYIQEVRVLVKHGIKAGYESVENNINYYKGKMVVNEQIKNNLVHKERFYVRYDEFLQDRSENRLVKATLLKLLSISKSLENIKEIQQLLINFEMVNNSNNYAKDFSRVVIGRNTKNYESLIRWSKVFLLNKSFSTFSGSTTARALLFPMEKVFEAYVGRNLKKILKDREWEVSLQDKGYFLFEHQFALRPDIVLASHSNDRKIILDTKWKSLMNNQNKNYGILQGDMYQMYAYAKKYDSKEIWLLYPVNEVMNNDNLIEFKSDDDIYVRAFFVDVENIEDSLNELLENFA